MRSRSEGATGSHQQRSGVGLKMAACRPLAKIRADTEVYGRRDLLSEVQVGPRRFFALGVSPSLRARVEHLLHGWHVSEVR